MSDYCQRWTHDRVARLGFLVGLGWSAEQIAADPVIAVSINNVYRQTQKLGLSFKAAQRLDPLRLSARALAALEPAAERRMLTAEALARRLVETIAAEPALIDNVLDDGEGKAA